MARPYTSPKHLRWAVLVSLGLSSTPGHAGGNWNCERSKDGKDWVCVTKGAQPAPAESAQPAPSGEKSTAPAESAQPAPSGEKSTRPPEPPARLVRPEEPAPHPAPILAEPAPVPRAGPTPAEPAAVPAKPVPSRPPEPALAAEPEPAAPLQRLPTTIKDRPPSAEAPAQAEAPQRPGWNCRTGEPGENGKEWDCALTGADPGGAAHTVGESGEATQYWSQSPTITREDEQRFQRVMSLLPANPWANACSGLRKRDTAPMTEFLLTPAEREQREHEPLEAYSDYFEMLDNEIVNFTGTADLVRADQKLWGSFVSHNTYANTLNARGNVVYQEEGLTFASDTAFLDMDTDRGVLRNTQYILEAVPARGTSRLTHLDSNTVSRYETATYTTCPPGNLDWLMHASNVRIDKDSGRGVARNAWLEFKSVPMFYSPYLSFPVDDRRQTGFLPPSFGSVFGSNSKNATGFQFNAPYYFNLAPNYDLTFTPRIMAKRGVLAQGEFRYLTENSRGRALLEAMPWDAVRQQSRGQAGLQDDTRLAENLRLHIDGNYVSDERYLRELGNPLNIVNWRYIRSNGSLTYSGSNYTVQTLADYYQTIDPTIPPSAQPYYHLPQVSFNIGQPIGDTGLVASGLADISSFQHTSSGLRPVGERLNLKPRLSYPLQSAAGFFTPSVTLHHSEYWLEDVDRWQYWAPKSSRLVSTRENSLSRTVPLMSLDSGVYFEREFNLGQSSMLQTLEPRLFYLYVPYRDQRKIPVFDSSEYDFTIYQLFRENRFTGNDRVGDANQLSFAVTNRFIEQSSGLERLRLSVGGIRYFQDRRVNLFDQADPTLTDDASKTLRGYRTQPDSNLIADAFSALSPDWSLRTAGQWNPERGRIDRGQVGLQYNNRANQILNLAYRFRRFQNQDAVSLDVTDVSFRLPISQGWYTIGRWLYSLEDQVTLDSFFGFERETCCWRFTLLGRHYINDPKQTLANNGVFLQLELKGLTRLGDQVDQFLRRTVSGYRLADE